MLDMTALLPIIIPLAILEVGLTLVALIHILKHSSFKCGNKIIWILASFITIIGPVLYFTIGKGEE